MLEVEMKFPLDDASAFERRLADLGAARSADHIEEDHYYNAPDRDFAETDEALRLRRIESENVLTYKGPKRDAQTKTRPEIEVPLAPGPEAAEQLRHLLVHLGYRPVAVVRKRRQMYPLQMDGFDMQVCIDEVEEVGRFAELEIVAPEDQFAAARDLLLRTAGQLGLAQQERRGYLHMLLEKRNARA
jgi:adenylate cyclase class 2